MNVFLTSRINENKAFLENDEAFHCFKVMRKRKGDELILIDGKGNFFKGEITEINKVECQINIHSTWKEQDKGYYLHLAVAPTKNISRFEWVIEKAIEIGVDRVTPIVCQHSERSKINNARLKKIGLAAVKQSLSAKIPVIDPLTSLKDFVKEDSGDFRFCAYLDENSTHLKKLVVPGSRYLILIGPEGDFSTDEIAMLKAKDWSFGILGKKRLRTETAAVVATQIINGIHF